MSPPKPNMEAVNTFPPPPKMPKITDLPRTEVVPTEQGPEMESDMPGYIQHQRLSQIPGVGDKRKEPPVDDGIADEWPVDPDPDEVEA